MIRVAIIMITLLVICGFLAWFANRKTRPSAREIELGKAVRLCRDKANQYRETDAGLSYEILDIVSRLEKRELL